MKFYILLTDTTILLSGAIICESGLKKLRKLTEEKIEVEETLEFNANSYEYVPTYEIRESGPDWGEKNVFYDHNGNEWHN